MSPYYSFLSCCALLLLATATAHAQSTSPPQAADTVAASAARASHASPDLPWWLPNAQECAVIWAEQARATPREARRRTRNMRRWAEEQPEPKLVRP